MIEIRESHPPRARVVVATRPRRAARADAPPLRAMAARLLARAIATRAASTSTSTTTAAPVKLYRGPRMRLFRVLVRFKIAQLGAIGALATPALAATADARAAPALVAVALAAGLGSAACGAATQYYASRYVGELALTRDGRALRVSTMDFWGNRVDEDFDVATRVTPPLAGLTREDLEALASRAFVPLDVVGARQFVVSLRHGELVDRERLFDVLSGGAARGSEAPRASS